MIGKSAVQSNSKILSEDEIKAQRNFIIEAIKESKFIRSTKDSIALKPKIKYQKANERLEFVICKEFYI